MKSKIEQKIEKAREATNEMFAALEELNEKLSEKLQPEFKVGDYFYCQEKEGGNEWLSIFKKSDETESIGTFSDYCTSTKRLFFNKYLGFISEVHNLRPATPSEIALLDSKLAEQGKRFDKEKLELVDIEKPCCDCFHYRRKECNFCQMGNKWQSIPKHKEPIIGEMAIFWDTDKSMAFCAILIDKDNFRYHDNTSTWRNAILYESIEQYKAFLKS